MKSHVGSIWKIKWATNINDILELRSLTIRVGKTVLYDLLIQNEFCTLSGIGQSDTILLTSRAAFCRDTYQRP